MRVLILGRYGEYTDIVYNAISYKYDVISVIVEDSVPKKQLLIKRIKHLGMRKVLGQVLFQMLIVPILSGTSVARIQDIKREYCLNNSKEYQKDEKYHHVTSVNSSETIELLKEYRPDVVVVNGTRIISKKVLESTTAKFINMHMGITPKYRGVHGAYWAFYEGDNENAGVTVHLIDEGIDTGEILYQNRIECTDKDNYCTYPYLQLAVGLQLELKALEDFSNGTIKIQKVNLPSKLWSHPTLFQYLFARIFRNIK